MLQSLAQIFQKIFETTHQVTTNANELFSVYISVYCLSDCSYDLDIRAQGSYLPDTCGGKMGLSKPNNGLCCPYNGCNNNGFCVIDDVKKEPICKCDSGYSGVGCEMPS